MSGTEIQENKDGIGPQTTEITLKDSTPNFTFGKIKTPKTKTEYDEGFEAVFGKVPKEPVLDAKGIKVSHYPTPTQPVKVKKHTDGTRTIQVGGRHYKDKAMQPWDIIDAWELNFYAGNVIKYILRYRHKDGLQDLQKARHYINKLIEDYADPT